MTRPPGPRDARVYFPLAGDRERGLAAVHVIDWGDPPDKRMTQAGPHAHHSGESEQIEGTIRTERLCGGCRAAVAAGQLIVELEVADGVQICGASYTLALALADKLVRGCLPRLAGRTLIASGQVKRDGAVAAVGRLAEKLAALEHALAQHPLPAPLLVLARENLDAPSSAEQRLLQSLIAAGLRCEGVAALADMGADWPPQALPEPGRELPPSSWRDWLRRLRRVLAAVLGWRKLRLTVALAIALIGALIVYDFVWWGPCARLSADPAVIERCWGPAPVTFRADCSVEHGNGDRPPRRCPSGTCLAPDDEFALEVRPAAAGWISVYYVDAPGQVFEDLRPDPRPWPVRAGQQLPLTLPPRINPPAVRPARGRFIVVLTHKPLPSPEGEPPSVLKAFLDAVGEVFVLCGDAQ